MDLDPKAEERYRELVKVAGLALCGASYGGQAAEAAVERIIDATLAYPMERVMARVVRVPVDPVFIPKIGID